MRAKSESDRLRRRGRSGARRAGCWAAVLALLAFAGTSVVRAQQAGPETEADLQFELAEKLFALKDYKTAAPVYRKFLKTYADDARREEARYKLALSHFKLDGAKERQTALAELLILRKEFPKGRRIEDCLFRSGHVRFLLGDARGAIADLLALGKVTKGKVRADLVIPMHHFLGRAYYEVGQNGDAVKHLSVVAKSARATRLRPFALIVLADAHLKLKNLTGCATALVLLLKDYPKLSGREEMQLKLAETRLALSEYAAALKVYAAVGSKGPFKDRAALGQARALFGLKKYADVIKVAGGLLAGFKETPQTKPLDIPGQCLYLLGLSNFNLRKYAPAADAFAKLLAKVKQGPTAHDAALKLCWSYYHLGPRHAKQTVTRCIEFRRLFPTSKWNDQVVFVAAEGYLRLKDYAHAIAQYKQVSEKNANYADALYRIAYSYHMLRKPKEAAQAYDVFYRKAGSHQRVAAALASAGGLYQSIGRYADAVARYRAYLSKKPRDAAAEEVLYQLGVCQAKLGKFAEMTDAFSAYTKKYPRGRNAATVHYWLGRHYRIQAEALAAKGDPAAAQYVLAVQALTASVKLNGPQRDETLLALAECNYSLGSIQQEQAAECTARAKGAKPAQKRQLEAQATTLKRTSSVAFQKAAVGFLDLIQRKPALVKLESVYFWTGSYFRKHGDPASAIKVFTALLRAFPKSKDADAGLYQLALLHVELKAPQHKAAIGYCDELLKKHPGSRLVLQAKFARAGSLYALRNYREAEKLYLEVSQAGAGALKVGSTMQLGHICFSRKEYAAAARFFAEVGLLYISDEAYGPEALYYAGRANVLLGDAEQATKFWQQLLGSYPRSTWTDRMRKELKPLGYVIGQGKVIRKK